MPTLTIIECSTCGAAVLDRNTHREYHKSRGEEVPELSDSVCSSSKYEVLYEGCGY